MRRAPQDRSVVITSRSSIAARTDLIERRTPARSNAGGRFRFG
jgi:hypothetical protein